MQEFYSSHRMEEIVECLGGCVFCCRNDEPLTILHAQSFFYEALGYRDGEIGSLSANQIMESSEFNFMQEEIRRSGFFRSELQLRRKDGRPVWVNCLMRRCLAEDGAEYICGILFDLTGYRLETLSGTGIAETRLQESERRYRVLMEESADPIFDYDLQNREIYCSSSFFRKFRFRVQGGGYLQKIRETDFVFGQDRERAVRDAEDCIRGKKGGHGEYRLKMADGSYNWFRVRWSVALQPDGSLGRISLFFTDIDKQKKETLLLKERAERDLLTGLYNHVTTSSLIDSAIAQSAPGATHAMLLIDIDNFKHINDRLGHLAGDEAVEELGICLKEQFREEDIVGRTGGDEFVVFLQNIPSGKVLLQRARMLNEMFRSLQDTRKGRFGITCSVGISVFPRDGANFHELFQKADLAMYAAKRSGKDHFCVYEKSMEREPALSSD